jgi:hypothetical protein
MSNVIQFPTGAALAADGPSAPVESGEQKVFSQDQAAQLTFEDGRLYGWASREGRLPAHYWQLEADLRGLLHLHGVVLAARLLALPVPFVRGWAVEVGLGAPGRIRAAEEAVRSASLAADTALGCTVPALADDAFFWNGTTACA